MVSFCADEHVPSVLITTLRSNGYETVRAADVVGQGTDDDQLLAYCGSEDHILLTNDKKDFSTGFEGEIEHAGILIYTDDLRLRRRPGSVVRAIESVLEQYLPDELRENSVWLDQWYDG